ncbi:hypothetical protein ACQ86F_10070 [Streptomyces venezuelae ATCC 10712]
MSFDGKPPSVRAPMQALGTVPESGAVRIDLGPEGKLRLPQEPVGCLVRARLDSAVRELTATGATRVRADGHTVTAELPPGSEGVAVLAAPRVSGWRCAAGDADPAPRARTRASSPFPSTGGRPRSAAPSGRRGSRSAAR